VNRPLLVQALDGSGSNWRDMWRHAEIEAGYNPKPLKADPSFEDWRRLWLSLSHPWLTAHLQDRLQLDAATARRIARLWWENIRPLFSDPRTRTEYTRLQTTVQDSWQLRRFINEFTPFR